MTGRWPVSIGDMVELVGGSPDLLVVDVYETGLGVRMAVASWRCPASGKIHDSDPVAAYHLKCTRRAGA